MLTGSYQNMTGLEHYFSGKLGVSLRLGIRNGKEDHPNRDIWLMRRNNKQAGRTLLGKLLRQTGLGGVFKAKLLSFPQTSCSISHSQDTVVCTLSAGKGLQGLGLDIELQRSVPIDAGRLYLSNREQRLLKNYSTYSSNELLRLWTVKEALFKADIKNRKRSWLSHYECFNPQNWFGEARLHISTTKQRFKYATVRFQLGYLSIAVSY